MKNKLIFAVAAIVFSTSALSQESSFEEEVNSLSDEQKMDLIMGSGKAARLHNFDTQSVDSIQRVDKMTSEDFESYIPKIPEVKAFYQEYIDEGMHPYDAYMATMQQLYEALQK